MCDGCIKLAELFDQPPWIFTQFYTKLCEELSDEEADPLPPAILAIVQGTGEYEEQIRGLWEAFKANPSEYNAIEFIEAVKQVARELWPEVMRNVLEVSELTSAHEDMLQRALAEHEGYLGNSLLPDIVKVLANPDLLDYRAVFLYAGALWSFGFLATITFDGLSWRDAADLFMFAGPQDEVTCTGPRGCWDHVGQIYTVAEILVGDIIPGHFKCMTSCRHMLIPVASPLGEPSKEPEKPVVQSDIQMIYGMKGGPGSGHHGHAGRPGQRGGSLPGTGTSSVAVSAYVTSSITIDTARPGVPMGTYAIEDTITTSRKKAKRVARDYYGADWEAQGYRITRVDGTYYIIKVGTDVPAPKPRTRDMVGDLPEGSTTRRLIEKLPVAPTNADWYDKVDMLRKSGLADEYTSGDKDFKDTVDDLSGFTQGHYRMIRDAGMIMSGERPIGGGKSGDLDSLVNYGSTGDSYYGSKVVRHRGFWDVKLADGTTNYDMHPLTAERAFKTAEYVNEAIRHSAPIGSSLYRGLRIKEYNESEWINDHQAGKTVDMLGAVSFTKTKTIATEFASGKVRGAKFGPPGGTSASDNPWVYEILPGSKGLDVNVLSPHSQGEVITQGKFEVVDISTRDRYIKLRQVDIPEQRLRG